MRGNVPGPRLWMSDRQVKCRRNQTRRLDGGGASADAELGQDMGDVVLNSSDTEKESRIEC